MHDVLQLVADGQHQQVGEADPVDGRDERHGDTAAQLAGIGEITHHVDQAHDRADDADRRGIAAHALEHLGRPQIAALLGVQVHLENAANHLWLGAIHEQLQTLAGIGIALGLGDGLEAQQTFLARRAAPGTDLADALRQVDTRREKNPADDGHGTHEHRDRGLQQHGAKRAPQHDESSRPVEQGGNMPTLEKIATDDRHERQDQPDQAEHIHQRHASLRWRPMSSRGYTASARLALTTAMGIP